MTNRFAKLKDVLEAALALLASLCFGASFGYNYGLDNQVVYMIGALRLVDPTILNQDWMATKTTHYHVAFKYLAALLIALDRRGWVVAIAQNAVIAAGMMCLYALLRGLIDRRRALPAFLILLAIAFLTRTSAASASYVFDFILQPSTLGSLAFLAALPFFAQGRWFASGIFVALSGLFHANFLVLLIMTFSAAHLMLGRRGLFARLLLQFAVPSLVLLLFLPMILSTAGTKGASVAQNITLNIRSPHHYVPGNAERDFIPFVAWQMIGAGAALHLLRRDVRVQRLGALIAGLLLVIWSGLVLSTLVHVHPVTQLFAWRLGPHCELLLQVLACVGAIEMFLEPASGLRRSVASIALLVTGVCFLAMYQGDRDKPAIAFLVLGVSAIVLLAQAGSLAARTFAPIAWRPRLGKAWENGGPVIALSAAIACVVPSIVVQLGAVRQRSSLLTGMSRDEADLYAWMRQNTPKDAHFLTPPDVEKMRYHGERSIVVDWKANPIIPSEVLEWYRRLEDVTGRRGLSSGRDLDGYNSMDRTRLDTLRARYDLDYAVVRRGREVALGFRVVHANGTFAVLDLRTSP